MNGILGPIAGEERGSQVALGEAAVGQSGLALDSPRTGSSFVDLARGRSLLVLFVLGEGRSPCRPIK
jgi:hypothetical protein